MAKFYSELTPELERFIAKQQIFFTGSAPSDGTGRVNVSPKGIDSFRCLDSNTVAYLDLTGSGNETAAHMQNNGRLTIMMCSFSGKPLILRLYGRGRIVRPQDPDWTSFFPPFEDIPGQRQIVVLAIDSIQTSCGYGVPKYDFQQHRNELIDWADRKGDDGLERYRQQKNQVSIDGLPAYPARESV